MILDKKKILSSLALAGILTAGVFGANVNVKATNEYLKPVGVYKKLVEGKIVVPYVLKEKNTPLTVSDIQGEFTDLELVNGTAVTDVNATIKTGDTFTANGIEYTVVIYGDVNKDGKVSTKDASLVQKIVVGKAEGIDSIQMEAADVNNNGKVTTKDALALQKYIVGKTDMVIDELPPIEDVTAPVLNGVPSEPIYIKLNDTEYALPEVTAVDDYDGKVDVTVVGEVKRDAEGTYTVTYTATDKAGNTANATLTVVVDGKAPVISGVPTETAYIKLNDSNFTLPEVTAKDEVNGEVEVTTEGTVDTATEGEYVVTYTATDKAGNAANATLTVVVDGKAPVISGVPTETAYINLNDSNFVLPEVTAIDEVNGEVEVTTEGTVDTATEGEYTVTYAATDKAGNTANATFTVVVDGKGPVLSGVTDGEKVYVKLNDSNFVLPEVTATDTVDGEVEVTTEGTVEVTTEGEYVVTYKATDSMNNTTTATLTVIVDGKAPKADVQYSTTVPTKDGVTVTIISDEEIQALEGWTLSDDKMSMSKLYMENVEDEKLMVSDLAGNETEAHITISNVDTKVVASVDYDVKTPTNGSVTATITSDEELQGVEGWTLSLDKKSMTKSYETNVIEDVVVKDVLGNETTVNINIQNIDKVAPTAGVQFDVTTMTNGDVVVTLIANEKLQSATGTHTWTIDAEDARKVTATFTANEEENVTITDLAGNTSVIPVKVNNIDKTAPTLTVKYDVEVSTNKDVTATIRSDEKVKAVEGWTLSEDGMSMSKVYEANDTEDVTISDLVGNTSKVTITIANIDKEAPVVNGFTEGKTSYKTVTPTFVEGVATLKKDNEQSKSYTSGTEINVDGNYVLMVKDAAGNTTTVEFVIDNVKPVFPALEDVTLKNGDIFDTTVVANDAVSGDITVKPVITFNSAEVENIDTTGANDGEYILTYTAQDEAGNVETATRRVIVDATAATLVSMESSNPNAATEVTIRVVFNEEMQLADGWVAEDASKLSFTKKYTANTTEVVQFKDVAGNITEVNISINNIDSDAPSVAVIYSVTEPTQGPVTATISAGEELKEVSGWTLSADKKSMTKTYAANTAAEGEEVIVSDLAGNTVTVTVKVTNIDTTAPIAAVDYSETAQTKKDVVATISADEELKEVAGWTLSEDKKSMTKTYTANTASEGEDVIVSDLAGNTASVNVKVLNIDREAPVVEGFTEGISAYRTLNLTFTDATAPITVILQKGTEAEVSEDVSSGATKVIDEDGTYKLTVRDALGNETTMLFDIDKVAAVISGVEEGKRYTEAKPVFTEGVAVLNTLDTDNTTVISTVDYVSGTPITTDGKYEIVVTDAANNPIKVKFEVDTKAPEVTNIVNNTVYTTNITPVVNEAGTIAGIKLVKDGVEVEAYTSIGEISEDGVYELTLTDDLGNSSTIRFTIDQTGPAVSGVVENGEYKEAIPTFTEGTATLQKAGEEPATFVSGTKILADGEYTLVVTDDNGNVTTIHFKVDNLGPVLTGVEEKTYKSGESVIPASTDTDIAKVSLKKDGTVVEGYETLAEITTGDGVYELTVTDKAGNTTIVNFTIDTVVKGVEVVTSNKGKATNNDVIATITAKEELQETTGWTLSEDKMSMTKVYADNTAAEGEDVIVKDIVGNTYTAKVIVSGIDKVAPTAGVPSYSTEAPTKNPVTVTIVANEPVQEVEGWTLAEDKVTLTKEFIDNATEQVTLIDLAGNEIATPVEVQINNIYNGLPTITGMFAEAEQNVAVSLTNKITLPTVIAKDVKGANVAVVTTVKQIVGETEQDYTGTELVLSAPTKYIITYTATDVAGNVATVQRVINVVSE